MHIDDVAKGLSGKLGIKGLECENNTLHIEIDGAHTLIEEREDGTFILVGLIGNPPVEEKEAFAHLLLEANTHLLFDIPCAISRHPGTGAYLLIERVTGDEVSDFAQFTPRLEKFADNLEAWRKTLENFSPASASAASFSTEQKFETLNALQSGFLRV